MKNEPYELNGFVESAVYKYSQTVAKTAFSYLKNTADNLILKKRLLRAETFIKIVEKI